MVQMFFRAKRRLKSEWRGLKSLLRKKSTKRLLKVSYVLYEVSRVIYNPFRILDLIFINQNKLLKNL